ncbi:RdgB/HAM1 family non-canonical purine NTP pyrophosphatase [Lignipirellula cremea]|uniref:dITP/XTP pyrophosphatase n=1 Tax=Lignipirellula cremea TaxID=2528010 RepID=A0A518E378_9BACT|nr:RdgB/HAM1 family non-canonical purine NTP pyrophosphatase [Lignipirellula cremea]QDU98547.1 Non-canonical purine NTP pyrophosphatase [Lignipirellula cremea]
MSFTLVLGTHNAKKRRELEMLLASLPLQLKTLADFPNAIEVEETGSTFAENAALKAVEQAVHLQQWVLGEDSGLMVDALDGAPGVYSARFSAAGDDASNNQHLLESLANVPLEKRGGQYVCRMTLSDPQGQVRATCEATCRGRILFAERGSAGFGYDPLFEIPEYHRTFSELGDAVKSILSHRARAMRQFVKLLQPLLFSSKTAPPC